MVDNFFYKNMSDSGIKNENMSEQQLAEELYKRIIRKFKKIKVRSTFIDNIWGAYIIYIYICMYICIYNVYVKVFFANCFG